MSVKQWASNALCASSFIHKMRIMKIATSFAKGLFMVNQVLGLLINTGHFCVTIRLEKQY